MKKNFNGVLVEINRANTDRLIDWLEVHNFYRVPASVGHHNAASGGLLKHSLEVCNEALYLRSVAIKENPSIADKLPKESVAIAALLHDICKWNVFYISSNSGEARCNKDARGEGHGLKSLRILESLGFPLTEDEKLAIWWHMGKDHEPSYADHQDEYEKSCDSELAVLIRKADYNATHLKERFEETLDSLTGLDVPRLKRYLSGSNFYTHHSGSHHHYSTGLVAHSLGTWRHMMQVYDGDNRNEAAAIALLHDIAMQNRTRKYGGHGWRSKEILKSRLHLGLSDEALRCVEYHKKHHIPRCQEEIDIRESLLWKKLYESDHFDADHDITDVYKHFMDERF